MNTLRPSKPKKKLGGFSVIYLSPADYGCLPVRGTRPASTTAAFPNPFGPEIKVAFTLASPQSVGLALYDALGRQVREVALMPQPVGVQQHTLPTAGLPVGVYSLHLRFEWEGRTEVLRVLKVQ